MNFKAHDDIKKTIKQEVVFESIKKEEIEIEEFTSMETFSVVGESEPLIKNSDSSITSESSVPQKVTSTRNRRTTCFYCSKTLLKRCLKLHTSRRHPNKMPAEKVDEQPYANWLKKNKSRESMDIDDEMTSDANDDKEKIGKSKDLDEAHQNDPQLSLGNEVNHLKEKIKQLTDLLNKKCDQLEAVQSSCKKSVSSNDIRDWLDEKTDRLCEIVENTMIVCSVCKNYGKNSVGTLTFDFEMGPGIHIDSSSFTCMKNRVLKHLSSVKHKTLVRKKSGKNSQDITAAKRLARTAYYINISSYPQTSYPDLVLLQHLNQSFMGDINHSEQVVGKFRDWYSEALKSKIKLFIQESPCVAIVADKVTINRKTLDVMAVIGIMPDCSESELFQSLVVGAPEVVIQNNETVAHSWKETLEEVGIVSCYQIASISTDGPYHHGKSNTPKQLMKSLQHPEINVPTIWDQAHLLELALDDVKEAPWVSDIKKLISTLNTLFGKGKACSELEEMALKTDRYFKKPIGFSSTRSSAHCLKVYEVFFDNLEVYYIQLVQDLKRNKFQKKDILTNFVANKSMFQTNAALLLDIYEPVTRFSLSYQTLQKLPWEKAEDFTQMIKRLEEMEASCTSLPLTIDAWPVFESLGHPMSQSQVANALALLKSIRKSCLSRMRGIDANEKRRQTSNEDITETRHDIKLLGDLTSLRDYSGVDFPQTFQNSLKKIQDRGLVPATIDLVQNVFYQVRDVLQLYKDANAQTRSLLKYLWENHRDKVFVRSYLDLVIRLWLLLPSESIVEALGISLHNIFGEFRNMKHQNAVKELIIRANGPPLNEADHFIDSVCRKHNFKAVREKSNHILREGVVMTRLKKRSFSLRKYF